MTETLTVSCPRGHGPLVTVAPDTLDGSWLEVGFCRTCSGLWVPHAGVASLIPQVLLDDLVWARVEEHCMDCSCGRFPGQLTFRSQQIGGGGDVKTDAVLAQVVEIDRCDECVCLWLDGGELGGLGGKDSQRVVSDSFQIDAEMVQIWGMGGDVGDRRAQRNIDGAQVDVWYDDEPQPGVQTRFSWHAELADCGVRGSLGKENKVTRLLRRVGVSDIEVGDAEFDSEFHIVSSDGAAMRAWLARPEVLPALRVIRQRSDASVHIRRDGFEVAGWVSDGTVAPDAELEAACATLYGSLR